MPQTVNRNDNQGRKKKQFKAEQEPSDYFSWVCRTVRPLNRPVSEAARTHTVQGCDANADRKTQHNTSSAPCLISNDFSFVF